MKFTNLIFLLVFLSCASTRQEDIQYQVSQVLESVRHQNSLVSYSGSSESSTSRLLSVSQQNQLELRERTVKRDKRKYRRGHGLGLRPCTGGYALHFRIPISAWYSPRANSQGDNAEQQNKLGGVSLANFWPFSWGPPNKNAVLVSFRPALESGKFEISAYINFPDRSWEVKLLIIAEADIDGVVYVDLEDETWTFEAFQDGSYGKESIDLDPMVFQYNIGPWFGGSMKALHTHSVFTEMVFD